MDVDMNSKGRKDAMRNNGKKIVFLSCVLIVVLGFAVYGNSLIELDNIDVDSNLEFVVKGDSNNIIVYKIN